MSQSRNPLVWHTLASIFFVALFWMIVPSGLVWWKALLCTILCVTLGHQLVTGIQALKQSRYLGVTNILKSFSQAFLIFGFYLVPQTSGWLFLGFAYLWLLIIKGLWKHPRRS